MKGEILFEKMTDISDEYVAEAALGDAYGNPRREKEDNPFIRFLNSGWGVAMICAIVSLAAVVGLVHLGRMGTSGPNDPAGIPGNTTGRFSFSYEIKLSEDVHSSFGHLQIYIMQPGTQFSLDATVTNNGLPFFYTGASSEYCPDARFVLHDDPDVIINGVIAHTTDVGTFMVNSKESGTGCYGFTIPSNAKAGLYDLVLSYKGEQKVFPGLFAVDNRDTDFPDLTDHPFSFEYKGPGLAMLGDTVEFNTYVINEGESFSYIGSPSDFRATAILIYEGYYKGNENYILRLQEILPSEETEHISCTVETGERGASVAHFRIPDDAPLGAYSLMLFFGNTSRVFDGAVMVGEGETLPPIDLRDHPFSFGYDPFMTTVKAGTEVQITAWVVNEGEAFTYFGDPYAFQPNVTLFCMADPSYTLTGFPPLTGMEPRSCTIQTGDVGDGTYGFRIPADAPAGAYGMYLTYGETGERFDSVLTVEAATEPVLSEKMKQDILTAYRKAFGVPEGEHASILHYYGQFPSGATVVMINCGAYTTALWEENVGPANLQYNDGNRIRVFYGGGFFTLPEAYEGKMLTDADLAAIENLQRQYYAYLYTDPDGLSDGT